MKDLLGRRPSEIELDRAALEIARLEYPDLDAGRYVAVLDRYAIDIADRTEDLSDGPRFIESANSYLFEEMGFTGNDEDYYNPENCFLNRVIETKLGSPIGLSLVYLEVARRLARPVVGIGLPTHFLVRYDDGDYSTFIDPFHKGALLDTAGCCRLLQTESIDEEFLAPVDKRSIAMRIVNNLRQTYFSNRDSERVLRLLDLLLEADPDSPDEHKQRAVALLQQRKVGVALTAFRRYLELAPDAPDRRRIQEEIRNLAFWLASRN